MIQFRVQIRYSLVVSGIKASKDDSKDYLKNEVVKVLDEVESDSSINDVDKFHRIGPLVDGKQDVIVRFKSHTAKEQVYEKRKNIDKSRYLKIKPSLCPGRKKLLNEAIKCLKERYSGDDLQNCPHFVYADVHGNLKLKMKKKVRNKMFYTFTSIMNLVQIIERCQGLTHDRSNEGYEINYFNENDRHVKF